MHEAVFRLFVYGKKDALPLTPPPCGTPFPNNMKTIIPMKQLINTKQIICDLL